MSSIDISDQGIRSLKDVDWSIYTQPIKTLICSNNKLRDLKGCPDTVETLNCSQNKLKNLRGCPENTRTLDCSWNRLTNLKGCSDNVKTLNCSCNDLESLDGCPDTVKKLYCLNDWNYCFESTLEICYPEQLPLCGSNLVELECNWDPDVEIWTFPRNILDIFMKHNEETGDWYYSDIMYKKLWDSYIMLNKYRTMTGVVVNDWDESDNSNMIEPDDEC